MGKAQTKNQKIYQWLIEQIQSKKINVGDQLPTEKSIMAQFGVNRTTVRTALSKLEKADMIIRRSGKGTFLIANTPPQFVRTFNRIELVTKDSLSGKTVFNTIEKKWLEPSDRIRLVLGHSAKELLSFTRVISVNDEPSLIEKTYLSYKLSKIFTDLDVNQPYYPLIAKYAGERLSHLKISFTAKKPNSEQQALLNIDEHHPCISMQSQLFNQDNQPLEVVESLYRGDKYLFTLESLGIDLGNNNVFKRGGDK
jgi:GntR family transcriptional regulator